MKFKYLGFNALEFKQAFEPVQVMDSTNRNAKTLVNNLTMPVCTCNPEPKTGKTIAKQRISF